MAAGPHAADPCTSALATARPRRGGWGTSPFYVIRGCGARSTPGESKIPRAKVVDRLYQRDDPSLERGGDSSIGSSVASWVLGRLVGRRTRRGVDGRPVEALPCTPNQGVERFAVLPLGPALGPGVTLGHVRAPRASLTGPM